MLTHDRPVGRRARPGRERRQPVAAAATARPGARRVAAQRLTRGLAWATGAGLALPLLLTWLRTKESAQVELPWALYLLSWVWVALLALLALVVAVWTTPARSAPPSSLSGELGRRWRARGAGRAARSSTGRRPGRGQRLVAVGGTLVAAVLLVLAVV